VCGSSGCLDSFVSIQALLDQSTAAARSGRSAALARALELSETLVLQDLVSAVDVGDPVAVQLARDAGRRVGETVAGLVAFANPSRIVLGGPVAALGPHLLNEMRGAIYRRAPAWVVTRLIVELGSPGDRSALLGAALGAADRAFDRDDLLG
jgi:predicted NBD/HSP70 family sugar kinase